MIRSFQSLLQRAFATVRFTSSHEYVSIDGDVATLGVTTFAAGHLGEVVHADLPEVGMEFEQGEAVGALESVKAAADVMTPFSGSVIAINERLEDNPSLINEDPENEGWMCRIKISGVEGDDLMDEAAYAKFKEEEGH
ncbi:putative multi-domain containing protein [Aduncisulcus paluster]|uniref:Glycine cleavage system H protein n=1 Tax=Aduncisulcus paluster TaxID=2918883 RepID=A0ABQ5K8K6_9EUKA|nr:putative multi-domain containing protein [Aduncisulcus paluster]|eukprot:gnl/Carplike_NY0171/1319_a1790_1584.p2 GENE.gnl/Carplike_NY0171/1319_a1790_1584~~gnl/Carplike_NY0171/1319_a1790_1584.p2  ORF type:complete len:138 (-),score=57.40 gnl/Carplike_NY0171/1319_a1790_1584:205-618(-)